MTDTNLQHSLGDNAADKLANTNRIAPQYGEAITPRRLVRFLDWKPLESVTLRVNRVKDNTSVEVLTKGRTTSTRSFRKLQGTTEGINSQRYFNLFRRSYENLGFIQNASTTKSKNNFA
ncbi:hypothetical protein [Leptospira ainlahdjerensis]|uniref:hypothetical protein n=1 Tax=Leptospira ainlahdjerensis TaxID=2810033 RepID=UPI001E5FF336|nr:hypothetical protein [Leptospira ainlahdjerensis]